MNWQARKLRNPLSVVRVFLLHGRSILLHTSTSTGMARALKGRLGYFARPQGRDEPFRARALAEPALQRTGKTNPAQVRQQKARQATIHPPRLVVRRPDGSHAAFGVSPPPTCGS